MSTKRQAIKSEIVHRESRLASLKGRLPLINSEHFQAYRHEKQLWLDFVKSKLVSQRTDEYTQGYLQGMVECLEDDVMDSDALTEKVQVLSEEIRGLRKSLSERDDRNFRSAPPGGGYRDAPPGVKAQSKGPIFPGGMQ